MLLENIPFQLFIEDCEENDSQSVFSNDLTTITTQIDRL